MKVSQIDYTKQALQLASEMVNKGLCEFTLHGGVYGTSVNHISISMYAPKWSREGEHFNLEVEFTTDLVGSNKANLALMENILANGFETQPEYVKAKKDQIEAKKHLIKQLQKQIKETA